MTWWFVKQEHSYCDKAKMWYVKFFTQENKIWCLWIFRKESAFSIITSKWGYLTTYSFNITFSSNCQFYLQFHCTAAKINELIFHISLSWFRVLFFILYIRYVANILQWYRYLDLTQLIWANWYVYILKSLLSIQTYTVIYIS